MTKEIFKAKITDAKLVVETFEESEIVIHYIDSFGNEVGIDCTQHQPTDGKTMIILRCLHFLEYDAEEIQVMLRIKV